MLQLWGCECVPGQSRFLAYKAVVSTHDAVWGTEDKPLMPRLATLVLPMLLGVLALLRCRFAHFFMLSFTAVRLGSMHSLIGCLHAYHTQVF
jgi:hypothetical protein